MTRDVRVIASLEGVRPVGFAQLEYIDGSAEITHVFVSAEAPRLWARHGDDSRCGRGGRCDVENLWIVADDEDRPEGALQRAWASGPPGPATEFLRLPPG